MDDELNKASRIGILGDDDFIERIRRAFLKNRIVNPNGELRELLRHRIRPELSQIRAEFVKELGARNRLIKKCTIFLAHQRADYKLEEIGAFFGIGPTAASVAFRKIRDEINSNEILRRTVEEVASRLFTGDKDPRKK